ncbi:hypothetical protein AB5N19_14341 [Seiridium cardinale]
MTTYRTIDVLPTRTPGPLSMEETEMREFPPSGPPRVQRDETIAEHNTYFHGNEPRDVSPVNDRNSLLRSSPSSNPPSPQQDLTEMDNQQTAPSRGVRSTQSNRWWWWWEIGAAFLSVACVVAITAVLSYIDNKTIKEWNFSISPNSLIAIVTTVSKAAMMVCIASCISQKKWGYFASRPRLIKDLDLFDNASRGPWGSFVFLSSLKIRSFTVSALSIITLLALGIEPAAQQILEVAQGTEVQRDGTASIPYAQEYSSKAADFAWNPSNTFGHPMSRDMFLQQSTIVAGAAGTIPELNVTCSESATECRWETISTLGICAEVKNVTEDIIPQCSYSEITDEMSCIYDFNHVRNDSIVGPTALVPDPKNVTHTPPSPINMWWEVGDGKLPGRFNYFASVGSTGIDKPGANLDLVRYTLTPETSGSNSWYGEPKGNSTKLMEAWRIQWIWCVHNFSDIVATSAGVKSFNISKSHIEFDADLKTVGMDSPFWIHGNSSASYLFEFIASALTDQLVENTDVDQGDTDKVLNLGRFLYGADPVRFADDLADTLSVLVRQNSSGDNIEASWLYGTAVYPVTYYHVRWPWLILPFAEAVLAALLLLVSILGSRRQPLLKSSQVALVVSGLDGGKDDLLVGNRANTLKHATRAMTVKLEGGKENKMMAFRRV